jgi:hypothetical protein
MSKALAMDNAVNADAGISANGDNAVPASTLMIGCKLPPPRSSSIEWNS